MKLYCFPFSHCNCNIWYEFGKYPTRNCFTTSFVTVTWRSFICHLFRACHYYIKRRFCFQVINTVLYKYLHYGYMRFLFSCCSNSVWSLWMNAPWVFKPGPLLCQSVLSRSNWSIGVSGRAKQNSRHFADDIFQMHFIEWKLWIKVKISLECISLESNQQKSTSPVSGWVPNRRQTITWINIDQDVRQKGW